MPYGGKYQLTETQTMVAKLPVLKGSSDTVTMMSYGFDPYLSSWSPYHGAVYAVTESFHIPGILQTYDTGSFKTEPAIRSTSWCL